MWRNPLKRGGYANERVRRVVKRNADNPHSRDVSCTAPYVKNPEKDFTRKKELPFETMMQLLIFMGGQ